MSYVIKAPVPDVRAKVFVFTAMKTMYGGRRIAPGDTVFVFASENAGGQGLVARGRVTAAEAVAKKRGVARQTRRVSVIVRREALAKRPLGRSELKPFTDWKDGRPETELAFKFTLRPPTRSPPSPMPPRRSWKAFSSLIRHGRPPRRPSIRRALPFANTLSRASSARRKESFSLADARAMDGPVKPGHDESVYLPPQSPRAGA